MDFLNELAKQLDEIYCDLQETDPDPRSPTYFDHVCLSHEYNDYMVRAILLSTQIRDSCTTELDAFWGLRGYHWNADTSTYERVLLL